MKYVSPSCLEMTGYTQNEFVKMDPELLLGIVHTNINPLLLNTKIHIL